MCRSADWAKLVPTYKHREREIEIAVADTIQDMTLEMLKGMQSDIARMRTDLNEFRTETNSRFEHLEEILRKQRRNTAGMLVMMQATAGDFAEHVTEIESA